MKVITTTLDQFGEGPMVIGKYIIVYKYKCF